MRAEVPQSRFREGDAVRIACGSMFDGYEGKVMVAPPGQKIAIEIQVFDRPVRIELEDWMIEPAR